MIFSVPYFLILITFCYASINSHVNSLAFKSGSKDVFDPGVCFQEATCLVTQNKQNLTCFGTELPYSSTSLDLAEDSESLLEVQDNLAM
ncbi:smoothened-like protein [Nephila pilipes]|uniref:Smoothened-like protein n=1 Tax=Nephila pilipes TaxID=299642 RepID=A0A8X6PTH9_NEPPI|nr:smoothened-like protein [Nephila pilipes]